MENWLTVKEAAPIVQMSEQALYSAIREKQFPAILIVRRIRISPSALNELTQAQQMAIETNSSQAVAGK